jgi:hypothetical protein
MKVLKIESKSADDKKFSCMWVDTQELLGRDIHMDSCLCEGKLIGVYLEDGISVYCIRHAKMYLNELFNKILWDVKHREGYEGASKKSVYSLAKQEFNNRIIIMDVVQ